MAVIETKVKAATAASAAVGVVVAVLNAVTADGSLLGPLPTWLQSVILAVAPAVLTFLSGWQAKHTVRGV
ncbi:holin [Streptomyces odontomachi]|uniref:holin n=1 Tax=Streptomyces odontomachi TaxID=2944940 RepID=UPI00210B2E6C|nr:holin [Streptomyces sp. ODS25]